MHAAVVEHACENPTLHAPTLHPQILGAGCAYVHGQKTKMKTKMRQLGHFPRLENTSKEESLGDVVHQGWNQSLYRRDLHPNEDVLANIGRRRRIVVQLPHLDRASCRSPDQPQDLKAEANPKTPRPKPTPTSPDQPQASINATSPMRRSARRWFLSILCGSSSRPRTVTG